MCLWVRIHICPHKIGQISIIAFSSSKEQSIHEGKVFNRVWQGGHMKCSSVLMLPWQQLFVPDLSWCEGHSLSPQWSQLRCGKNCVLIETRIHPDAREDAHGWLLISSCGTQTHKRTHTHNHTCKQTHTLTHTSNTYTHSRDTPGFSPGQVSFDYRVQSSWFKGRVGMTNSW